MRLVCLFALFAAEAAAQVGDGLITFASRSVNVTPDQAEFVVVATSDLDTPQSDVVAALRKLGIQNLTVNGVAVGTDNSRYPAPAVSQLYYAVTFTTAPGDLKDFAKRLDAAKTQPPDPVTSVQYSAVLSASPAAVESAHQATLPALLNEAKTKAQALAQTAGLKLGAVQGLSESSYGAVGISSGYFLAATPVLASITSASSGGNTQFTFTATVKFGVQ